MPLLGDSREGGHNREGTGSHGICHMILPEVPSILRLDINTPGITLDILREARDREQERKPREAEQNIPPPHSEQHRTEGEGVGDHPCIHLGRHLTEVAGLLARLLRRLSIFLTTW